ncbi:TPA: hypothetical protein HA235_07395 [Candidatus Woesearchaeota archaeon]|nr:hypothetical protein [Candidatus Woesearchaeota archaeon]HIH32502.1 hypothetical protein [Candidatus Woesearchaeota archaeon]HIH55200.1 hypothetical protein [Candidatus Woesearchaeota archaeon]HIJ01495.1 hypothetical protein [Candidatus Woesearchaeota archaeon]HIJ13477.1 hypothetical protein [Candidatus Woesearchaeota archaeon]
MNKALVILLLMIAILSYDVCASTLDHSNLSIRDMPGYAFAIAFVFILVSAYIKSINCGVQK